MIDFGDLAGGEADLVAIRRVAAGCCLTDFLLREFTGEGIGKGRERIAGTGHPHGLIDIGTAGEWVADATAEASGRSAEGFDFSGMVVGLVLEHHQPVLTDWI